MSEITKIAKKPIKTGDLLNTCSSSFAIRIASVNYQIVLSEIAEENEDWWERRRLCFKQAFSLRLLRHWTWLRSRHSCRRGSFFLSHSLWIGLIHDSCVLLPLSFFIRLMIVCFRLILWHFVVFSGCSSPDRSGAWCSCRHRRAWFRIHFWNSVPEAQNSKGFFYSVASSSSGDDWLALSFSMVTRNR